MPQVIMEVSSTHYFLPEPGELSVQRSFPGRVPRKQLPARRRTQKSDIRHVLRIGKAIDFRAPCDNAGRSFLEHPDFKFKETGSRSFATIFRLFPFIFSFVDNAIGHLLLAYRLKFLERLFH